MRHIGRRAQLEALDQHAQAVREHRAFRLVILIGEAGVGKSRLAQELAHRLGEAGWRFASARCPADPSLYRPWSRMLAALEPGGGVVDLSTRDGAVGLLRTIGADPCLLVLDDLHRADAATLAALALLHDLAPAQPLLVVACGREPLPALPGGPAVFAMQLLGLDQAEVLEFLEQQWGAAVDPTAAAVLCRRTDGNPHLLATLFPDGPAAVLPAAPLALPVPAEIQAEVAQLLSARTGDCRQAIAAAAVIGREFDLHMLERVLGLAGPQVLAAIDEAIDAAILVPRPHHVYRFRSAVVREAVYAGLGVRDRAGLHDSVAAALPELAGPRSPTLAELAHHRTQASVLGGAERLDVAIATAVAAANEALARAPAEAVEQLTSAMAMATRAGWPSTAQARLLVAYGHALLVAGEPRPGRDALAAALRQGAADRDTELTVAAALALGPSADDGMPAGEPDPDRCDTLAAAIDALADTHPGVGQAMPQLSQLQARLATALLPVDTSAAAARLAESATTAESSGDPGAVAEALVAGAEFTAATGAPTGSVADLRRAVREAATAGDEQLVCRAHLALASHLLADGALDLARVELVRVAGRDWLGAASRWRAEQARAHVALLDQQWAGALELGASAAQLGQRVGPRAAIAAHLALTGAVAFDGGPTADLVDAMARMAEQQRRALPGWLTPLAVYVAMVRGERALAVALLNEYLPDLHGAQRPGPWLLRVLAEAALATGDAAVAARVAAELADMPAGRIGYGLAMASAGPVGPVRDRLDDLSEARPAEHSQRGPGRRGLTEREHEVFTLAIGGLPAHDIAVALFLSDRTVETHLASIYRKLGVRSRVELIARHGRDST